MKPTICLFSLLALLALGMPPGQAENATMPGNTEFKGVQQIFSLIHNVSLRKNDPNVRETLTDLMDMKGELYAHGLQPAVLATPNRTSRPQHPFHKH